MVRSWFWLGSMLTLTLVGCGKGPASMPPPKTPEVLVGEAIVQPVTDFENFTGRTEASERVEIRARVTGYLDKSPFTEGELVKEGDLLFQIDPRPLAAELSRAEAAQIQAKAAFDRLERDFNRMQPLVQRGAISREEFDKVSGNRDEARAAASAAESNVKIARLNLQFTEVRAPFAGRVSRRLIDPGNLVKADETVLTYLVNMEKIYVYFDVDERTLLRQFLQAGRLESSMSDRVPIQIGLADEEGYHHQGVVNFVDNRVDPGTGSLWMRGEFIKPSRPIRPGIFVRIKLPLGEAYKAVLVAEQALATDQGQKYLYVVDSNNVVSFRPVKVGKLHQGLRVIRDGLKAGERVVVTGLQRVRPGSEIVPKPVEMSQFVVRPQTREQLPDGPPATKTAGTRSSGGSGTSEIGK